MERRVAVNVIGRVAIRHAIDADAERLDRISLVSSCGRLKPFTRQRMDVGRDHDGQRTESIGRFAEWIFMQGEVTGLLVDIGCRTQVTRQRMEEGSDKGDD
jgi:hypothetical protein